jgi:hypothetical protein
MGGTNVYTGRRAEAKSFGTPAKLILPRFLEFLLLSGPSEHPKAQISG